MITNTTYLYITKKCIFMYSKTCLKQPLKKKTKIGSQDQLSLNAGQKYCRMLQEEHSAILSTFIMLSLVFKTFVCLFLSGLLRQILLYRGLKISVDTDQLVSKKPDEQDPHCFPTLLVNTCE